jgi:beta-glucosidase
MPTHFFMRRIVSSHPLQARAAALLLTAALASCSAMPRVSMPSVSDVTSLFGGGDEAPAAQEAASAPQPAVAPAAPAATPAAAPSDADLAASSDIHPEVWPATPPAGRDSAIEAEVQKLLSRMTLEEKVGQILQIDIAAASPGDVKRYHLGSILNGGDSAPGGNLRAAPELWLRTADAYYDASAGGRLGIPVLWGIDAVHGNDHIVGATLFPHNIGLGATRDPALLRKIGEITAQEIRITGQDWAFAPTIAVARDDRWGRTYEAYSEDAGLVSLDAAAMIEGLQGKPGSSGFLKNGHVLASAKHYLGDGATDQGVNAGDSLYSEMALRDVFAAPYRAAIAAGAQNVMVSYSSWRGTKMHANKALVHDVLFGRLGFDGFTVSDYQGFARVPGCTVVDCPQSFNAGIDMYMSSDAWKTLYGNLVNQVSAGIIPQARLDEAVARILRVKLRMGLLTAGKPSARPYAGRIDLLGSPEHREVARQAVRESLVLLKNDGGLLPLSPRSHVLVAGEGAQNMAHQTGGWTIGWQGRNNSRADFPGATTIFEGIKADVEAAGGTATLSEDGSFRGRPDVAIVVFGEEPYAESAGDVANLDYQSGSKHDLKLLQRLQSQGIPIVAVFLSGRPLYVTPEINAANAFVAAWLPGSEGEGVADLLFSKPDGSVAYDFRGKLSFSWPRSPDQTALNVGTEPYDPLFAFGYGLTYGAPRNIGRLPEFLHAPQAEPVHAVAVVERRNPPLNQNLGQAPGQNLMEGGILQPGWSILAAGQRLTGSKASGRGLSARQSGNAVEATWSGRIPTSLTIAGAPASFMREAERDMSLSLTLKLDEAPAQAVVLAMGCGPLCGGKLDVTNVLQSVQGRGWTTLNVPLSCLKAAGSDLANVTTPFALTTSGSLTVSLSSVKIVRTGEALSCAAMPPVTAASVVTGPGPKFTSDQGSKKKAAGSREKKKKHAATGHKTHSKRHKH